MQSWRVSAGGAVHPPCRVTDALERHNGRVARELSALTAATDCESLTAFQLIYHCLLFGRHVVQHYILPYCILSAEFWTVFVLRDAVLARYMQASWACPSVRLYRPVLSMFLSRTCVCIYCASVSSVCATSLHIWSVLVTGRVFRVAYLHVSFWNAIYVQWQEGICNLFVGRKTGWSTGMDGFAVE